MTKLTAAGEDNRWSETSFAWRVLGADAWTPLGTAESDTPTVYADLTGLAKGTIVEFRAVSVDAAGRAARDVRLRQCRACRSTATSRRRRREEPCRRRSAFLATFNSELGCASDWAPDCTNALLTRQPDGAWSGTFALPAGTYQFKIAVNGSWDENYGAGGVPGGGNIPLTVARTARVSRSTTTG